MFAQRVWTVTAVVAVLVLTGCGGGEETPIPDSPASDLTSSAPDGAAAGESVPSAMSVNDEVRQVCEDAVTERLAGSEFPNRSLLRAASSAAGRTFTVTGSAQVDGTGHPYACEIEVAEGETTVTSVTVDGQEG